MTGGGAHSAVHSEAIFADTQLGFGVMDLLKLEKSLPHVYANTVHRF